MSQKLEDKPPAIEQPLDTQPTAPLPGRRLFIFKAIAILGGAAGAVLASSTEAQADVGFGHQDHGGSGNDSYHRRGRRRWGPWARGPWGRGDPGRRGPWGRRGRECY
jgi:hypothetical protein